MNMTKSLLFCGALAIAGVLHSGCELTTEDPPPPNVRPARTLVINEVFTLPPTNQRQHCWLELYNPTPDTINLTGWSLEFSARQYRFRYILDSNFTPRSLLLLSIKDSVYRTVFGVTGGQLPGGLPGIRLNGYNFITIGSNESKIRDYTDLGPGDGPKYYASPFIGSELTAPGFVGTATLRPLPDTTYEAIIGFNEFMLKTTDQIVLRNARDEVVDVVRYGNYTPTGTDPFPNNRSIGVIPEFQSIARWAGAYYTGNTAEDFYITGTQVARTRPIPHWLSQAFKP
jgi:hypothetical protein